MATGNNEIAINVYELALELACKTITRAVHVLLRNCRECSGLPSIPLPPVGKRRSWLIWKEYFLEAANVVIKKEATP